MPWAEAHRLQELENAYEEDIDDVFDVAAVRCALDLRLKNLESELHQVPCLDLCWCWAAPGQASLRRRHQQRVRGGHSLLQPAADCTTQVAVKQSAH